MNLFRALLTVSGFTLLSRVTGLVRETLIARAFGASQFTDAFYVAFRIPNLLRRLSAEGAFSQAFVPILAEFKNTARSRRHQGARRRHVDRARLGARESCRWRRGGCVWRRVHVASGLAHDGHAYRARGDHDPIMFPYIIFISLTSLASGVLNTYRQLLAARVRARAAERVVHRGRRLRRAASEMPVYALACAVIVGGVLQFIVQLPGLKKIDMMPRIGLNLVAGACASAASSGCCRRWCPRCSPCRSRRSA